jgi:Predicted membrane protein (DUF2061)
MRVWYRTTRSSIGIRATFLDLIANAIRQSRRMALVLLALAGAFRDSPGSFILIDSESGDTVGLGIIETTKPSLLRPATNLRHLIGSTEAPARSMVKAISWRATGSFDTLLAVLITGSSKIAGGEIGLGSRG